MVLSQTPGATDVYSPYSVPDQTTGVLGLQGGALSAGDNATGMQTRSTFPVQQGATNGTIGPQAADATVVYGVNTAGSIAQSHEPSPYAWIDNLLQAVFTAGSLSNVPMTSNVYAAAKELLSWMALIGGTLLVFIAIRFAMCIKLASRRQ